MKGTTIQKFFIVLIVALFAAACAEKTSVRRTNDGTGDNNQNQNPYYPSNTGGNGSNGSNSGGGGDSHGDGSEPGISDGGQTTNYYTISNIIVHGTQNPNRHQCGNSYTSPQTGTTTVATPPNCYHPDYLWSSAVDFPSSENYVFETDSRFNLRVIPRPRPSHNSSSVKNINCHYGNGGESYSKLQIDVCVRSATGSCNNFNTVTFPNVAVNGASKVKEFHVPVTNQPLVVEVRDVQSDHSCVLYGQGYCPISSVWDTECVRFDIQFATDDTKDIPGPRL